MHPSLTTGAPKGPAPNLSGTSEEQPRSKRRKLAQIIELVAASYAVDFSMAALLVWAGAVPAFTWWVGSITALGLCLVYYVMFRTGWSERFKDRFMVVPQMATHSAIILAFIVWVPQIGLLLLPLLFIAFAFSSLRLSLKQAAIGLLLVSAIIVTLLMTMGQKMMPPSDTWQQRAICGVWFSLSLARTALLGLMGASLRQLLVKRNDELAATFEKLEHLANRDELTGALNRRSVMRLLDEERQRMQRTGQRFGVALFDIDHFKQVNDGFGHLVGDEALRQFARTATGCMRNTDRMGRYGGEEFLMLLTATADETSARVAADRVRECTAEQDWATLAPGLKLTVSAGVALCEPGESAEHLLARADYALYEAKREGRNRVRIGAPTLAIS